MAEHDVEKLAGEILDRVRTVRGVFLDDPVGDPEKEDSEVRRVVRACLANYLSTVTSDDVAFVMGSLPELSMKGDFDSGDLVRFRAQLTELAEQN